MPDCNVNGCGDATTEFIPDFGATELCNQHDTDYNEGGGEYDRLIADIKFIVRLRLSVRTWSPSLLRSVLLYFTELIYTAIRKEGSKSFNYHNNGVSRLYDSAIGNTDLFKQREDYLKGITLT